MRILLCLVFAFLGAFLFAIPSRSDEAVPNSAASVNWDFAKWCQVGDHKFILEKATLDDLQRALGSGKIQRLGDPGNVDPLWVIFYRTPYGIVRFESDGDMGGDEHRLTGVSFYLGRKVADDHWPLIKAPITFPFGEVGMTFSQLKKTLGDTSLQKGVAHYKYAGETKVPDRKDIRDAALLFDVSGYLTIHVVDGKIIDLNLSHVTTS